MNYWAGQASPPAPAFLFLPNAGPLNPRRQPVIPIGDCPGFFALKFFRDLP
jgi:hypothetical protein